MLAAVAASAARCLELLTDRFELTGLAATSLGTALGVKKVRNALAVVKEDNQGADTLKARLKHLANAADAYRHLTASRASGTAALLEDLLQDGGSLGKNGTLKQSSDSESFAPPHQEGDGPAPARYTYRIPESALTGQLACSTQDSVAAAAEARVCSHGTAAPASTDCDAGWRGGRNRLATTLPKSDNPAAGPQPAQSTEWDSSCHPRDKARKGAKIDETRTVTVWLHHLGPQAASGNYEGEAEKSVPDSKPPQPEGTIEEDPERQPKGLCQENQISGPRDRKTRNKIKARGSGASPLPNLPGTVLVASIAAPATGRAASLAAGRGSGSPTCACAPTARCDDAGRGHAGCREGRQQ